MLITSKYRSDAGNSETAITNDQNLIKIIVTSIEKNLSETEIKNLIKEEGN